MIGVMPAVGKSIYVPLTITSQGAKKGWCSVFHSLLDKGGSQKKGEVRDVWRSREYA